VFGPGAKSEILFVYNTCWKHCQWHDANNNCCCCCYYCCCCCAGRTIFKLDDATVSNHKKRQLLDANGCPLLHSEKKTLSLHGTWLLLRPSDGAKVAELKPALMSFSPGEC
jgi:hypothetical protein